MSMVISGCGLHPRVTDKGRQPHTYTYSMLARTHTTLPSKRLFYSASSPVTFSIAISWHSLNSATRICHHMRFLCPLQLDSDWPLTAWTGHTASTSWWLSFRSIQARSFDVIQKLGTTAEEAEAHYLSKKSDYCVYCNTTWTVIVFHNIKHKI